MVAVAKSDDMATALLERTTGFDAWYAAYAEAHGTSPDPDDPQHEYDYRAFYDKYKPSVGYIGAVTEHKTARFPKGEPRLTDEFKTTPHDGSPRGEGERDSDRLARELLATLPTGEERVSALEARTERERRMTPRQLAERERRHAEAVVTDDIPPGDPRRAAERYEVSRRLASPVLAAMDIAATPAYATIGALRALRRGEPILPGAVAGVRERATAQADVREILGASSVGRSILEEHPYMVAGAGFAADALLDPSNIAFAGTLIGAKALGRGALAVGRRTPGVAAGIRRVEAVREVGKKVRAEALRIGVTTREVQAIGGRAQQHVQRTVKEIAEEAGPPRAVPWEPRPSPRALAAEARKARVAETEAARAVRKTELLRTTDQDLTAAKGSLRQRTATTREKRNALRENQREIGDAEKQIGVGTDAKSEAGVARDKAQKAEASAATAKEKGHTKAARRHDTRARQHKDAAKRLDEQGDEMVKDATVRREAAIAEREPLANELGSAQRDEAAVREAVEDLTARREAIRARVPTGEVEAFGRREVVSQLDQLNARRGIASEAIGTRVTAEIGVTKARRAIEAGGRVPVERRGVTFRPLQPGEDVTEEGVANLTAALAERASLSGRALTPADAEAELLSYAASLGLDTTKMQHAATLARMGQKLYRRRIVDAGIKTMDELMALEREGGYLRRIYGRYLSPEEHLEWLRENDFGHIADRIVNSQMNRPLVLTSKGSAPVKQWAERRNLVPGARRVLEPVDDVLARMGAGTEATARILPRMESFKRIAADPDLVSDIAKPGWFKLKLDHLVERAQRMEQMGHPELAEELLTQAQQGGWGALTGKYVHPQVYFALNPVSINFKQGFTEIAKDSYNFARSMLAPALTRTPRPATGALGLFSRGFAMEKGIVTLKNPVSQGFNALSNMSQMHVFAGVPPAAVGPLYTEGFGDALHLTDEFYYITKHMGSLADQGSLVEFNATVDIIGRANAGEALAIRAANTLWTDYPARLWQVNEVAGKIGVVKYHWRAAGLGKHKITRETLERVPGAKEVLRKAVGIAEASIYNYNDIPRWTEWSRAWNIVMPFPTFWYKTVGQFTQALAHHPQRLNLYTRAKQAVESLTPEEERRIAREVRPIWLEKEDPLHLPGKDPYGRTQYFRMGRAVPWGSLTTDDVISGRSPFLIGPAIEAARNETFYGMTIANPEAPWTRRMAQKSDYLVQSYFPLYGLARRTVRHFVEKGQRAKMPEEVAAARPKPKTPGQLITRTTPIDVQRVLNARAWDLAERGDNLAKLANRLSIEKGLVLVPVSEWPPGDPDKEYLLAREQELVEEQGHLTQLAEDWGKLQEAEE